MITNVNDVILAYVHEGIWAGGLAVISWIFLFPFRHAAKYIKEQWEQKSALLTNINSELILQRTNCLTTLQTQGGEQTAALKEVAKTLTDIRVELASQTGHLEALQRK